jgi:hypothetical protein
MGLCYLVVKHLLSQTSFNHFFLRNHNSAWIDIICSFPVHSRNTISYFNIGEVLDDIMEDRLSFSRLPTIEVKCIDGSYVSSDNRRLWILKQLERLGRVNEVNVKTTRWMYLVVKHLLSQTSFNHFFLRNHNSAWIDIICSFPVHNRNTISYFNKNSNCSS